MIDNNNKMNHQKPIMPTNKKNEIEINIKKISRNKQSKARSSQDECEHEVLQENEELKNRKADQNVMNPQKLQHQRLNNDYLIETASAQMIIFNKLNSELAHVNKKIQNIKRITDMQEHKLENNQQNSLNYQNNNNLQLKNQIINSKQQNMMMHQQQINKQQEIKQSIQNIQQNLIQQQLSQNI